MAALERILLASGNLASRRRTVTGALGQLLLVGMDEAEVVSLLRLAGLPGRALEDPDFPISLDQELVVLSQLVARVRDRHGDVVAFALAHFSHVGINHYGVLGLTMQHAPSVEAAVRVLLAYPELSWGHSRIEVLREDDDWVLRFDFGAVPPSAIAVAPELLHRYCVTQDLASVYRLVVDVTDPAVTPRAVALPWPAPGGGFRPARHLPCPVHFGASRAELRYALPAADAVPRHASALEFRRYERIARGFSRALAEDVSPAEQATRLLWAYTPPPTRGQLAAMMDTTPRTLVRRLAAEGTSYAELLGRVQSERATNYLRHTALPVAEIAERMGYSDPAAFTRAFRGWTGEAPGRWRRRAR
mgnify:CR=1 FL=1